LRLGETDFAGGGSTKKETRFSSSANSSSVARNPVALGLGIKTVRDDLHVHEELLDVGAHPSRNLRCHPPFVSAACATETLPKHDVIPAIRRRPDFPLAGRDPHCHITSYTKFDPDRPMSGIDIPSLVSAIRKAGDMTQEQLAQRLGVTFGTINGWENGRHAPLRAFRNLLIQLARELGVDSLASGDSETGPSRPSKRRAGVRR
jgi:DNA-binding transcriptional regulator YiaG